MKLDETDKRILELLQKNSRITNASLAAEVGISPPAMLERVKRLENAGIIKQYVALVDHEKVGQGTMAFVTVSLAVHQLSSIDEFTKKMEELDEVLECYHIAGGDDFILKVALKNIQEYERFVLDKLTVIKGVNRLNTTFVLSTMKYKTDLLINTSNGNDPC